MVPQSPNPQTERGRFAKGECAQAYRREQEIPCGTSATNIVDPSSGIAVQIAT
jgi:hypothetical protein